MDARLSLVMSWTPPPPPKKKNNNKTLSYHWLKEKRQLVENDFRKCIIQVDHWPWVKFFTAAKKKGFWTLSDVQYTVLPSDVDRTVQTPDITICGTRLLYHFPGIIIYILVHIQIKLFVCHFPYIFCLNILDQVEEPWIKKPRKQQWAWSFLRGCFIIYTKINSYLS